MIYKYPPGTMIDMEIGNNFWIKETRGITCSYEDVHELHGYTLANLTGAVWARWGKPDGDSGIIFNKSEVYPLYTTGKVKEVVRERPYDPTQMGDREDDI